MCNSGSKVFVVGNFDGVSSMYVSLNNGVSWENADIPHDLYSVAMFGDIVLACGPQGMYRSPDGGQNWYFSASPTQHGIPNSISIEGNIAVLSGTSTTGGDVLISTDGGLTWTSKGIFASPGMTGTSSVISGTTIYVAGSAVGSASLWKSVDSGTTFTPITCPLDPIIGMAMSGSNLMITGTYYNGPSAVFISTDGGETWNPPPVTPFASTVCYSLTISGSRIIATGVNDGFTAVYISEDFGTTWIPTYAGNPFFLASTGPAIASVFTPVGAIVVGPFDGTSSVYKNGV